MTAAAGAIRTQVAIVGAGPAGLLLARLLDDAGIESVVIENRGRDYVEKRIRAGLLEQGTVELLERAGVAGRLHEEGIVHHGIHLQFDGERHRVALSDLAGGRTITIYGQTEIVKDLIGRRLDDGLPLLFEVDEVALEGIETATPRVRFLHAGARREIECDVIAGCDGFHGVCRPAIAKHLQFFSRDYPLGWLGILAAVAPSSDELVYAHHERGFALLTLRSPELSRLYIQCAPDERIEEWPDARIWEELQARVALDGWSLAEGPVLEKGITGMRSFVSEPMQHGRLFLAGDAAHIVPPTGAKGLNLAVADVALLAAALVEWFGSADDTGLRHYSAACLARVWRAEHFSYWMTSMLHTFGDPFEQRLQLAQLRYVVSSEAAARTLAENYVGLAGSRLGGADIDGAARRVGPISVPR
ncbi:MAG TPA: 4-hydroxybenzoate 3-monooxygenase [Solirubrobacteraceae bacterium]|nr:4-hydroxybenzoate 3-monooxygenase [Solirubrobacteraceae bacterium]